MKKVKLTRIVSTNNNLRTEMVEGYTSHVPVVGESFVVISKSLDSSKDIRHVATSQIKEIGEDMFTTLNSTYRVEIGKDVTIGEIEEDLRVKL